MNHINLTSDTFRTTTTGFFLLSYEGKFETAFLSKDKIYEDPFPMNTTYLFSRIEKLHHHTIQRIEKKILQPDALGLGIEVEFSTCPCQVRHFDGFEWHYKNDTAIWGLDKLRPNKVAFMSGRPPQNFTSEEVEAMSNGYGVAAADPRSTKHREFWML